MSLADTVVIDELLCYLANKVDVLNADALVTLCVGTFTEQFIEDSKLKLYNLCKRGPNDPPIDGLSKFTKRKGDKKSAQNVKDMIGVFNEQATNIPTFVAANLNLLPPLNTSSIDVVSVLRSVETLKADVRNMKTCMDAQQAVMRDIQSSSFQSHTSNMVNMQYTPDITVTKFPNNVRETYAKQVSSSSLTLPQPPRGGNAARGRGGMQRNRPRRERSAHSVVSRDNNNVGSGNDDASEWETQRPRRRKRKFITGKSTQNPELNGVENAPSIANVFVTRLPPRATEGDIAAYLLANLHIECNVKKIMNTKHDNVFSSFHIQCTIDDPNRLLDPNLWPEHSLFRKWYPPRRQRNDE